MAFSDFGKLGGLGDPKGYFRYPRKFKLLGNYLGILAHWPTWRGDISTWPGTLPVDGGRFPDFGKRFPDFGKRGRLCDPRGYFRYPRKFKLLWH